VVELTPHLFPVYTSKYLPAELKPKMYSMPKKMSYRIESVGKDETYTDEKIANISEILADCMKFYIGRMLVKHLSFEG
jgi:hypothetical protein